MNVFELHAASSAFAEHDNDDVATNVCINPGSCYRLQANSSTCPLRPPRVFRMQRRRTSLVLRQKGEGLKSYQVFKTRKWELHRCVIKQKVLFLLVADSRASQAHCPPPAHGINSDSSVSAPRSRLDSRYSPSPFQVRVCTTLLDRTHSCASPPSVCPRNEDSQATISLRPAHQHHRSRFGPSSDPDSFLRRKLWGFRPGSLEKVLKIHWPGRSSQGNGTYLLMNAFAPILAR